MNSTNPNLGPAQPGPEPPTEGIKFVCTICKAPMRLHVARYDTYGDLEYHLDACACMMEGHDFEVGEARDEGYNEGIDDAVERLNNVATEISEFKV